MVIIIMTASNQYTNINCTLEKFHLLAKHWKFTKKMKNRRKTHIIMLYALCTIQSNTIKWAAQCKGKRKRQQK